MLSSSAKNSLTVSRCFFWLQGRQAGTTLSIVLLPPLLSGSLWSNVRFVGINLLPQ